jgi:hypothetical protein
MKGNVRCFSVHVEFLWLGHWLWLAGTVRKSVSCSTDPTRKPSSVYILANGDDADHSKTHSETETPFVGAITHNHSVFVSRGEEIRTKPVFPAATWCMVAGDTVAHSHTFKVLNSNTCSSRTPSRCDRIYNKVCWFCHGHSSSRLVWMVQETIFWRQFMFREQVIYRHLCSSSTRHSKTLIPCFDIGILRCRLESFRLDGILLSFPLAALITSNELGYELSQRESSWNPPNVFRKSAVFGPLNGKDFR